MKLRITYPLLLAFALCLAISCGPKKAEPVADLQIAIIADVHLQDVYGQLADTDFQGLQNPGTEKNALIRTMGSQLQSTRIFNENYFAFMAALDDVVARGIKYVLLPGDFSDDGQPIHIRGLKRILEEYSSNYGISFFLVPGNHDVVYPFEHADGKADFLGEGGKPQPVVSPGVSIQWDSSRSHPPIISRDIRNLGYSGIAELLGDYGFFPKAEYRYWASPFSEYSYSTYDFEKAAKTSTLDQRRQLIPDNDIPLPDLSYVAEAVDGLWVLALDANTYLPRQANSTDTTALRNTGRGLNNLLGSKTYLLEWVAEVVDEAEKEGKTLIAFGHYPMVDFTNRARHSIEELLIGSKMQAGRIPDDAVAELFANAGLKLHFGGHMHLNDTGVRTTREGNTLVNIQVPSLAAYVPAYKVLRLKPDKMVEVQTVRLDTVPRFDEFFPLYREELEYLRSIGSEHSWDEGILDSKTYGEFINWHLKELVRLRFMKSDWPGDFAQFLENLTGEELLLLSLAETDSLNMILDTKTNTPLWQDGIKESLHQKAGKKGIDTKRFQKWSGEELIFDLYRLRGGDELAHKDIGEERLQQYQLIVENYLNNHAPEPGDLSLKSRLFLLLTILQKFMQGAPSEHFQIDLESGMIKTLKEVPAQ